MSNKKKWPELGIITKNPVRKKDDNGNFIKDSNGNFENLLDKNGKIIYNLGFKLADNVTVLVDGEEVKLGKGRTGIMKTPQQTVEGLYKAGVFDDSVIEEKRQAAEERNSWLRYSVQLPPPRD